MTRRLDPVSNRVRADVHSAKAALAERLLTRPATAGALTRFAAMALSMAPTRMNSAAAPIVLAHAIHGVGVGRKLSMGKATQTLAVRLYVPVKLPRSAISRG